MFVWEGQSPDLFCDVFRDDGGGDVTHHDVVAPALRSLGLYSELLSIGHPSRGAEHEFKKLLVDGVGIIA